MDAYTLNYLTQGKSVTLKKLYCLNLTKLKSDSKRTQVNTNTIQRIGTTSDTI